MKKENKNSDLQNTSSKKSIKTVSRDDQLALQIQTQLSSSLTPLDDSNFSAVKNTPHAFRKMEAVNTTTGSLHQDNLKQNTQCIKDCDEAQQLGVDSCGVTQQLALYENVTQLQSAVSEVCEPGVKEVDWQAANMCQVFITTMLATRKWLN